MLSEEVNPYIGPRPFNRDAEDQKRFFGRDFETDEIISLIFTHQLVLVYSQSGAGKTSIFNAQIAPTLEKNEFDVLPLARVGISSFIELHSIYPHNNVKNSYITNLYLLNVFQSLKQEFDDPQLFLDKSLSSFLNEYFPSIETPKGKHRPQVLILDQLEELFGLYIEGWREQQEEFFKQVTEALNTNPLLRVVFVIREDYLAQLDPFLEIFPEALRPRFRLERLREDAALSAITMPLHNTNRFFQPGAAKKLVNDLLKMRVENPDGKMVEVKGEFVEPVHLQVVCHRLWLKAKTDGILQITEIQIGDVNEALEFFYNDAINDASNDSNIHQNEIRRWVETSLITATGTRSIVHRGPEYTGEIPNIIVDILEKKHLTTSERRAGGKWYELTHDRMIEPIKISNARWNKQREETSKSVASLFLQASQYISTKQYDKALKYYEKSLTKSQNIGDNLSIINAILNIGRIYENKGEIENAKTHYLQALSMSISTNEPQTTAFILILIGRFSQNTKDYDSAMKYFLGAEEIYIQLDDNVGRANVLFNLASIYEDIEDYDSAVKFFSDGARFDPDNNTTYILRRAAANWYGGHNWEALLDYNRLFESEPDTFVNSFDFYNCRGQILAEMGEFKKAIDDLKVALELGSRFKRPDTIAYPLSGLALAHGGLGEYKQSLDEFETSIKTCPNNAWAYYNRAQIYGDMGETSNVIADLKMSLEKSDPSLSPIKRQKAIKWLKDLGVNI